MVEGTKYFVDRRLSLPSCFTFFGRDGVKALKQTPFKIVPVPNLKGSNNPKTNPDWHATTHWSKPNAWGSHVDLYRGRRFTNGSMLDQQEVMIHELAHVINKIPPNDLPGDPQGGAINAASTMAIRIACF